MNQSLQSRRRGLGILAGINRVRNAVSLTLVALDPMSLVDMGCSHSRMVGIALVAVDTHWEEVEVRCLGIATRRLTSPGIDRSLLV